jgi:hypothetical protein
MTTASQRCEVRSADSYAERSLTPDPLPPLMKSTPGSVCGQNLTVSTRAEGRHGVVSSPPLVTHWGDRVAAIPDRRRA